MELCIFVPILFPALAKPTCTFRTRGTISTAPCINLSNFRERLFFSPICKSDVTAGEPFHKDIKERNVFDVFFLSLPSGSRW